MCELTTAMQMLPLTAAASFEHRGPQCLLTLTRSTSPPLDQFPVRVCSCLLCIINRLYNPVSSITITSTHPFLFFSQRPRDRPSADQLLAMLRPPPPPPGQSAPGPETTPRSRLGSASAVHEPFSSAVLNRPASALAPASAPISSAPKNEVRALINIFDC